MAYKDNIYKNVNESYSGMQQDSTSAPMQQESVAMSEHECTDKCDKVVIKSNGQWCMEKRCWEGYEPTPGKKPYEKGSCQPVKKEEVAPKGSNNRETYLESFGKSEVEVSFFDNGDVDLLFGEDVSAEYENEVICLLAKNMITSNLIKVKLEDLVGSRNIKRAQAAAGRIAAEKWLKTRGLNPDELFPKEPEQPPKKNKVKKLINKSTDWSPKAEHKSEKGGLTEAGRKSYNKATGGNLKAPQPEGGPRKRSFCARNKGQIKMHGIDCKKDPEKRACKARRRWKCSN